MASARPAPTAQGTHSPRLDLKRALTLRVVSVALICFLVAAALAFYGTSREIRQANETVAQLLMKQLQLQLFRIEANLEASAHFPDWDPVIGHIQAAGQCVHFMKPDGGGGRSSCVGVHPESDWSPSWLSSLSAGFGIARAEVRLPVSHRGKTYGILLVSMDSAAVLAMVWREISGLLCLTALLIGATCVLQYHAIGRALSPTKDILVGLDRLAGGDLSCRLPNFELTELQRISQVFNSLAVSLEQTTRERAALAAKLVNSQEQERRHLARELHDELAQTLSAMSAAAASIKRTAQVECPTLVTDAIGLSHMATALMQSLRRTLRTLRPPEIDDFGLVASLKSLIRDQERRAGGKLMIRLEVNGDLQELPPAAAPHIYRIVQEGLTNISKHANASRAHVALEFRPAPVEQPASAPRWLSLTIENDGCGAINRDVLAKGGLGLIGMRERAMALGGQLDVIEIDRSFKLRAAIPLPAEELSS